MENKAKEYLHRLYEDMLLCEDKRYFRIKYEACKDMFEYVFGIKISDRLERSWEKSWKNM